jgi:hypothetical protein
MNKLPLIFGIIFVLFGLFLYLTDSTPGGGFYFAPLIMYIIGGVLILLSFWKKK